VEQAFGIASTTPGATIGYATDTPVPSTSSTKYTGPIAVNASQTVKAFAAAMGCANSSVDIAACSIAGSPQLLTGLAGNVAAPNARLSTTLNTGAATQVWFL